MFGDMGNPSRLEPPSGTSPPRFPIYLLPSLNIPFGRRRKSSAQPDSTVAGNYPRRKRTTSERSAPSVPSLSTSPVSSISDTPTSPTSPVVSPFPDFFPSSSQAIDVPRLTRRNPDTLRCGICSADVAFGAQIVSKGFTGRHGRAFLVSPPTYPGSPSCPGTCLEEDTGDLVNVRVGRPENRQLVTGQHVVADISCLVCGTKLGWKYVDAREQAQKYKVGKFILETQRVVPFRSWEHTNPEEEDDDGSFSQSGIPGWSDARTPADDVWKKVRSRHGDGDSDSEDGTDGPVVFDSEDDDECEDIFAGTWDAEVVAQRRRNKVSRYQRKGVASA